MWILRFFKGVGRVLLDPLFIIFAVILTSMVLSSVSLVWAFVLTIPLWLVCALIYKGFQSLGSSQAQPA